jgi:hypothetical protein
LKNVNLTRELKTAFIIVGSFVTAITIMSFLSLMAAVFWIRGLVAFYARFLWLALMQYIVIVS